MKEWFGHTSIKSTEVYAKIQVVDKFREIEESKKKVAAIRLPVNRQ